MPVSVILKKINIKSRELSSQLLFAAADQTSKAKDLAFQSVQLHRKKAHITIVKHQIFMWILI